MITELNKKQKEFICNCKNPKIKRSTLCKNCENGGLRNGNYLKLKAWNFAR